MKNRLVTGLVLGAVTAGLALALCLAYGGGGSTIPGALPILVANAGLVGFLAGLIAGGSSS